ncbi:pilus assembly protein TadG-related protein [Streptomyces hundungensis]|uniref:pilus assembly protein TadG-related protein n=1 Tax=Streptomyces hundungensis TaxID=1077946 RepID=UPI0033CAE6E7
MSRRLNSDRGQAFPIYITVVAGLLFLAFAYFAWGQASVKRSETQTAADAAALAAAQDARDKFRNELLGAPDLRQLQDLLDGKFVGEAHSCGAAMTLADANDAVTLPGWEGCHLNSYRGDTAYYVKVESKKPVGKSIIAATEDRKGTATATAVIEPRCRVEESAPATPSPGASGDDKGKDKDKGKGYKLVCDGRPDIPFDLAHLAELLPSAADLFSVHLVNAN